MSRPIARLRRALGLIPNALYKGGGLGGTLRRGVRILRQSGPSGVWRSVRVLLRGDGPPLMADPSRPDRLQYREWLQRFDPPWSEVDHRRHREQAAAVDTAIAFHVVVPLAGADAALLARCVASLQAQAFGRWQACLVLPPECGPQLRQAAQQLALAEPRLALGHSLAAAVAGAGAGAGASWRTWLTWVEAGDTLAPDALLAAAQAIAKQPDAALVYSDEDRLAADGLRSAAYFKPGWNPELARSQDYACRMACLPLARVARAGGLDEQYGAAAWYALVLRCAEDAADAQVVHLPRVLYHRRVASADAVHAMDPAEYAPEGGERAVQAQLDRLGLDGEALRGPVGFHVRYRLPADRPLVSLIIPTRNGLTLVRQCIESIVERTTYRPYEIILVDNGSDDPEALRYFDEVARRAGVRVLRDDSPFNYSALNNQAAAIARGEVLGLINNDIEVISPGWLDEMVAIALQPGVGAVGARLWYPTDTLQHAGVVLGYRGGVADHAHRRLGQGEAGYFGRAALMQDFSAVTAACLIVRKALFDQVGGLDAEHLKVAYNDVDFCLRLREAGYRNVWTPAAELYHHESATRPSDLSEAQIQRFLGEEGYMKRRWGDLLFNDPAYSPNLTLDTEDFSLAWPPRRPLRSGP